MGDSRILADNPSGARKQPGERDQEFFSNTGEVELMGGVVGGFCVSATVQPSGRGVDQPRLCASSDSSAWACEDSSGRLTVRDAEVPGDERVVPLATLYRRIIYSSVFRIVTAPCDARQAV